MIYVYLNITIYQNNDMIPLMMSAMLLFEDELRSSLLFTVPSSLVSLENDSRSDVWDKWEAEFEWSLKGWEISDSVKECSPKACDTEKDWSLDPGNRESSYASFGSETWKSLPLNPLVSYWCVGVKLGSDSSSDSAMTSESWKLSDYNALHKKLKVITMCFTRKEIIQL